MSSLCLSLDIDWAHDVVIHDTLDLLAAHNAKATFFVTHETQVHARIRAENHELGLHPNFNPLLDGKADRAADVLARVQELAPEATSIRSHSLVRSSRLSVLFAQAGLTHESNVLISGRVPMPPWRDPFGLIQVPIHWEDDVALFEDFSQEPTEGLNTETVHVCNFHPIHVFLNSKTLADYENTRALHHDPQALRAHCRPLGQGGTRDRLIALLSERVSEADLRIRDL